MVSGISRGKRSDRIRGLHNSDRASCMRGLHRSQCNLKRAPPVHEAGLGSSRAVDAVDEVLPLGSIRGDDVAAVEQPGKRLRRIAQGPDCIACPMLRRAAWGAIFVNAQAVGAVARQPQAAAFAPQISNSLVSLTPCKNDEVTRTPLAITALTVARSWPGPSVRRCTNNSSTSHPVRRIARGRNDGHLDRTTLRRPSRGAVSRPNPSVETRSRT